MSVKSLIDRLQPFCQGWTRTGTRSLLTLAQEAQDVLLNHETNYTVYTGTGNTGFPPYLKTTTGTTRYAVNNTNLSENITRTIGGTAYAIRCRRVLRIFVDVTSSNYDYLRRWIGEPYARGFFNPYSSNTSRLAVADVPARFSPALENTEATVEFQEDPGTTTDIYFCNFIWEAPRLTAETVPFAIPADFEAAIEDYIMGKVSELENGKISERTTRWLRYWQDEFKTRTSDGVQITDNSVQPEFC